MPTTPSKSSLGPANRRRPQKAHVPYRDGVEVGKKTGIAVEHVQRKSDGFEPFEDVMGQADKRTPPTVKGTTKRKRKSALATIEDDEDDEDENGEMSMELETWSLKRSSDIDFDKIPTSVNDNDDDYGGGMDEDLEDYAQQEPQDVEMEDDIAQGLEDVEQGEEEDQGETEQGEEEDEHDDEPITKKKGKGKEKEKEKKPEKPRKRKVARERSPTPPGVRRGLRHRYKPLEWWRQEKVVYDNTGEDLVLVPHIKEIIRIPKEPVQPLSKHKRKRTAPPKSKSQSRGVEEEEAQPEQEVFNPELGWDDKTDPHGIVIDFVTQQEVERRVAFTSKMVSPRAAANNDWFFQKVFGDGDFIAAGQLIIPPKSTKPSKGTKDNTYVFYVIEGAIRLNIHQTSLVLCTGGMFLVPRGNTYFIENIATRDAKLFFTQARKIAMGEDEQNAILSAGPRRASTDGPGGRSSSTAAGSKPSEKEAARRRANSMKI